MEDTVTRIDDALHSADDEDSLDIASKSWNRVVNAAVKTGYREGIEDGSESVFQEGFDIGYKEAFESSFLLGKYKSLQVFIPKDITHPTDINKILSKTKQNGCNICFEKSKGNSEDTLIEQKSFLEILNDQKLYFARINKKLYEYFKPLLMQVDINIEKLGFPPPSDDQYSS